MDPHPPEELDLSRANGARVYDYLLGGAHNFAVDRDHAQRLLAANPGQRFGAQANRAYLGRVVRWCLQRGVTQFLDLGSGVPTVGNVHEIAHHHDPGARVAYVDIDPVAAAHSAEIIRELAAVTITQADFTDPDTVLHAPTVSGLLDLDEPVALLAIACLHFAAGDAETFIGRYREHLAPGSVLAISHGSDDIADSDHAARMRAVADTFAGTASPVTLRSRAQILELLGDFELAEHGLVDIADWPEPDPRGRCAATWAAVAIKRAPHRPATQHEPRGAEHGARPAP